MSERTQASGKSGFAGHDLLCLRGGRAVFAGLRFRIGPGEALILTGPNGSGKSSLLRLMAGLLPPADGWLERDGGNVTDDPAGHRQTLHFIAHADACKPVLTVTENLRFWSRLNGAAGLVPAAVPAALQAVGLAALADVPGRLLSAGQRRRLALARLVAAPAPLWLLDEPTTALDRESVGRLEEMISAHRARGGMAVLSTHTDLRLGPCRTLSLEAYAPGSSQNGPGESALEDGPEFDDDGPA